MCNFEHEDNEVLNLRDTVKGRVRERKGAGLHIDLYLDDKEQPLSAFGYWCGRVKAGTEVICSIKRWAKEDKDILVTVDSIAYENEVAMAA